VLKAVGGALKFKGCYPELSPVFMSDGMVYKIQRGRTIDSARATRRLMIRYARAGGALRNRATAAFSRPWPSSWAIV
jgi:hypothetical protein